MAQTEARLIVAAALSVVTEWEPQVVVRRYGLEGHAEQSLREVGAALGMTAEGVRLAENRTMKRMRQGLGVGTDSRGAHTAGCGK